MEMIPVRGKNLGGSTQSISGPELHMANPSPAAKTVPTTTAAAKAAGKYTTTSLAYPLNIDGEPQQGHYITFYAKVSDPAKLKAAKFAQRTAQVAAQLDPGGEQVVNLDVNKLKSSGQNGGGVKSNAIQLQPPYKSTLRTAAAISLYMPPSVQVSYDMKYGEPEVGLLAESGYEAIKAFQSGAKTKDVVMKALGGLELGAKQAILKTLDVAAPGATTLFAIDSGKIITPKMELMFEGIGRRNFSFSFVLIPKSAQEAQVIKDIVYHFKYHMSADYVEGSTREMKFPDMFDIEYMHLSTRNENLNKIATCALKSMNVEYGGDRYVAYEGGVPQTTKISLNFTEFDIITKKHIEDGY